MNEESVPNNHKSRSKKVSRRRALKTLGLGATATVAVGAAVASAKPGQSGKSSISFDDRVADFFQEHYKKMSRKEVEEALERLERKYKATYDVEVKIGNKPAEPGVLFGYALSITLCKGYRECVKACTEINNQSRDPEIQFIRVLEMNNGSMNLEEADHYYSDDENVPRPGKYYLPIQCHQCQNPPCVKSCPVEATWKEPDGVIVIDYNWCIGCRMCMNACPYWARRFNWKAPSLPKKDINPDTHYLSNRPRDVGVTEKCFFCLQRTREGELPACLVACPTGARVFGNLLDPNSEIRYVLKHKSIFRLKEDLQTDPKFWYFSD